MMPPQAGVQAQARTKLSNSVKDLIGALGAIGAGSAEGKAIIKALQALQPVIPDVQEGVGISEVLAQLASAQAVRPGQGAAPTMLGTPRPQPMPVAGGPMGACGKGERLMASMDKWAPSSGGVRDPRDPKKKNGMFWNFTRYLYIGGAPGAPKQAGSKRSTCPRLRGSTPPARSRIAARAGDERREGPAPAAEPQVTQEQALKLMQTGQLFATLAADPKTRNQVLGLIKQAKPDLYIPELEVSGEVDKKVAERVKPYEEKTEALSKELSEIKGVLSRQTWAAKAGISEEEAVEVEKVAEEAGITKGETALEYWAMKQQPRHAARHPGQQGGR